MPHHFRKILTRIGDWTAHPAAFLVVVTFGVVWLIFDRETNSFEIIAAVATWLMTMHIKRSDERQEEAINAKIDEVLRVLPHADTSLRGLDNQEIEDVVKRRTLTKRPS